MTKAYIKDKEKFLPISVWYSGGKARAPMLSEITPSSSSEWLDDLKNIKKLGFNTVRTWVEWANCEKNEGNYNFENLELLCELADKTGLKVFLQIYADSAPDWVGRKYPDSLFEAQNGSKIPSQSAPGFCSDNDNVCKHILDFYREAASRSVKYPNFFGYDLWSEPHIVNWVVVNFIPDVQFCYCPYTKKKFQAWLRMKYKELNELNKAWYRNFEAWGEVEPPRFGTILSYTDFIDWKTFIYQKMASDLKMRADAVRQVDTKNVITSHAAVPSIFYSPFVGYGPTDDFLMAETVDYYGTSIYPKHSFPDRHWELWKIQIAMDFSRSANNKNGGFYIGELQAGFGVRGVVVGDPVTPEDHRIWIWSAIAKNAKGVNFYAYYPMISGYESGGYGLVNLDGSDTKRAVESGRNARIISKHSELFTGAKPVVAQVALVYGTLQQMVGGEQNCGPQNGLRDSLAGYFRILVGNNIPFDFIHLKDLEEGLTSQYKLIIIPYPMMFSCKAAEGLRKFIEEGGNAAVEARFAWNDERGFSSDIIPGMGFHEIFGVRENKVRMSVEVDIQIKNGKHVLLSKMKKDEIIKGAWFAETLSIIKEGVEVIGETGHANSCMTEAKYKKGKALFIGTFLGLGCHQFPNKANSRFLLNMIKWADVERPFISSHDGKEKSPVEIRLHEYKGSYLLFVINHSKQDENIIIDLGDAFLGRMEVTDIIQEKTFIKKFDKKSCSLSIKLKSKDVSVLKFDKLEKL